MAEKQKRKRRRRRKGHPPRDPAGVARRVFGIKRLKPEQERAMAGLLEGRDTLAVLPTGYGKSLIYQVPALLHDRPTVVISPLIALMVDQEQSLVKRGVPVVRLDSTLRVAERRKVLERIAAGGRLIVLTTPETLESKDGHPALVKAAPWLLCVDEAHCISEWGHDFRPAYMRLGEQRRALGNPRLLALTATATPRVREDIATRLKMRDPLVVVAPPHRPNLALEVRIVSASDKAEHAGKLLRRLPRPGIVYCATTREVDGIHSALTRARIPTAHYHGRMSKADREEGQRLFLQSRKPLVMVATSAFGMGIDKPDIRWILHYQVPGSLEQYVQESGRAGRDGKRARCILLYDPKDLDIQRFLLSKSRAGAVQLRRVASALVDWAGEKRPATASELALSAGVPSTICRATCDQLEELGLVTLEARRYLLTATKTELTRVTRDLAKRLETQRREDEQRLEALDEYARLQECRSAFIRRYFGEEDPPVCGMCDICRVTPGAQKHRPQRRRGGKRKAKRKGRRRRRPSAKRRPSGERRR